MDKYFQLRNELIHLPGHRVLLENSGLNNSIYIFDKYFVELNTLLEFMEDEARLQDVLTLDGRPKLVIINRDIVRLLHNYVASAMSLIDHTRRIYRLFFEVNQSFAEYNDRVTKVFIENPLSQFVKSLRQYCQHYKSPNIVYLTSFHEGVLENQVCLAKNDLLLFEGWSSTAKMYLEPIEKNVHITEVASLYREKVISFYQWFQTRYSEILQEEISEFKEKETELLTLQLEEQVAIFEANSEIQRDPRQLFSYVLTDEEYSYILSLQKEKADYESKIINLVEQRLSLSESIKVRISLLLQK